MAALPVVMVTSLSDLESLVTPGGPRRVVLVRAASISETLGEGEGAGAGEGEGAAFDLTLTQGPWIGGALQAPDLLLFDADGDVVGVDADERVGCHDDLVAQGWVVENFDPFTSAIDVGLLLERITGEILPGILANPDDRALLHRLRDTAAAIRRLGKDVPGMMGHAPVALANHLKRKATEALARGTEGGGGARIAAHCGDMLARVLKVYGDEAVYFD